MMSDLQLCLIVGLPVAANGAMFLLFQSNTHKLLHAFRSEIEVRLDGVKQNVDGLKQIMDARFDAQMQALLRVEQVMDARLRVLEQR